MTNRKCANCGDHHEAGPVCAINWPARLAGQEDAGSGDPLHAKEYPTGTYGHADYWLGYYEKRYPWTPG